MTNTIPDHIKCEPCKQTANWRGRKAEPRRMWAQRIGEFAEKHASCGLTDAITEEEFDAVAAACVATFETMTPHQRKVSRALVDAFNATVTKLRDRAEQAEIDRGFYELTVKERDLERHRVDSIKSALRIMAKGHGELTEKLAATRALLLKAATFDDDGTTACSTCGTPVDAAGELACECWA